MYALVDCNNFYVSCERLFNPKLEGKPVIVLSNNDGCAIARSEEAKALGIVMGSPAFLIKDVIKNNNISVFSSNYSLYGDMSDRVMKTLDGFASRLEIYSIDEAFLDLDNMEKFDLAKHGLKIRRSIINDIGIPVTVGIAPTKTLAKMANRYAKKYQKETGVFWAANNDLIKQMLGSTDVGDIWGIGHNYSRFLLKNGFKTALDLISAPEDWFRNNMTVVGLRLLNELKGIPSIKSQYELPNKKNICTSRSFGNLLTDPQKIKEALGNYAASCASKLRQQNTLCRQIEVFIQTNPHKTDRKQYIGSIKVKLENASNSTGELIKYAFKGFDRIFRIGYEYMKCGVIVMDFIPDSIIQGNLFSKTAKNNNAANDCMDAINKRFGKDSIRVAVQGFKRPYKMKAQYLSPCYTTNINQVVKVKN